MPGKMAQISPLGRRSGCQDYGRRPRRQAVLSKRGNSAKIHPGLGFIWGIPVNISPGHAPWQPYRPIDLGQSPFERLMRMFLCLFEKVEG